MAVSTKTLDIYPVLILASTYSKWSCDPSRVILLRRHYTHVKLTRAWMQSHPYGKLMPLPVPKEA